jgi:hypothetical protein
MQGFLDFEIARIRGDELRAEAARIRLARARPRGRRTSTRRRVARALLALGFFFVSAGRDIGRGEEVSDGACVTL